MMTKSGRRRAVLLVAALAAMVGLTGAAGGCQPRQDTQGVVPDKKCTLHNYNGSYHGRTYYCKDAGGNDWRWRRLSTDQGKVW